MELFTKFMMLLVSVQVISAQFPESPQFPQSALPPSPTLPNPSLKVENLRLTPQQKRALDKFKAKVMNQLPEPFMKYDIYLNRFLRAKGYDVPKAVEFIMEDLQWRKENRMSQIYSEDFSDIEQDYVAYVESFDKQGQPIIMANFGDWDLRKAAFAGKMNRLNRYVDRTFEIATRQVRQLQARGRNVTRWNFIINMNNYNVIEHGCVQCIPFYIHLTNSAEMHFPGCADKIMLINTPPVFEAVLNIIRPLMSPSTRRALEIYNQNKYEWQPKLHKVVSRDQLPPEYGGTKVFAF